MERTPPGDRRRAAQSLPPDIRVEQVTLLYQYVPVSLIANVLIAGCVVFSLSNDVPLHSLTLWSSLLLAALALRTVPYVGARQRPPDTHSVGKWEWLFTLGACATGSVWGFCFPLLGVASAPESERWFAQAILIVSGAGIAAGGVFVMSYRAWPARFFVASILLPAFGFFALGGTRERTVSALILIFLGFLYRSSAMTSSVIQNNMLLRREATASEQAAKASQKERDAATEEFRTFSEALPDLLLKLDAAGTILWANRNAETVLGGGPAGLKTRNIGEFLGDERQETIARVWDRVQHQASHSQELRLRTVAGEMPYLLSAAAIRERDGSMSAVVGVAQDVSSLKTIESQLGLARDAAERANRAKSEFLANMSHEIRTPLNAVIGLSELAIDEPLPGDVRDYIEKIHLSGVNLLAIVNDILDFSKIEAGKLEMEAAPFQLAPVLDLVRTHAAVLSQGKDVVVDITQAEALPPAMIGDAIRLSQVLTNLVSNAVKFTDSGRVGVRAELVARQGLAATVRFQISDTGIGMSPEQIQHIFQPFAQADTSTTRRFGGTGLGLTICTRLLELMGGRLEVESTVGKGSTFTVLLTFRVAVAPSDTARAGAVTEKQALFAGRRALLAEDNLDNQLVAEAVLTKLGLWVEVAANGRDAVEKIERAPSHYDVVFMDMQMPLMDGIEATRIIRHRHAAEVLPIIAMTANAFEQDRTSCLEAGMNDFIGKPFRQGDVASALSRWVRPSNAEAD